MQTIAGVGSEGTFAGRTTEQISASSANSSRVIAPRDEPRSGLHDRSASPVSGEARIPVTFWVPDGSCFEGVTPHVADEILFVESKQVVPVDTAVTIRIASSNDGSVNWALAKGTVVWNCPDGDQFKNRQGFGVCLQGRWPQPLGQTKPDGSKEDA